MVGHNHE
ncbi:Multifunctional CCA protein, partial [Haemophilus influenzae]